MVDRREVRDREPVSPPAAPHFPLRLALALASALVLSWNFQAAVRGIGLSDAPEQTYTMTPGQQSERNPATQGGDVWLRHVMVDGQHRSLESLERTGPWSEQSFGLAYGGQGEPATVRVRGRHAVLCFVTSPWSGLVRFESDGVPLGSLDLYHKPTDRTPFACAELAGGRMAAVARSGRPFSRGLFWALLPLLAALLAWRPWKSSRRLEWWVVAQIASMHALVWLFTEIGSIDDAPGYLAGVEQLLHGETAYFPPGYPLFLAPWALLVPRWTGFLTAGAQHAGMILALIWLRRMAARFLGEDLATLGMLLAGSVAPTLFLPQMILSENVALMGMAGALWFASRKDGVGSFRNDVIAGLFAGLATLARVVPIVAVGLAVALVQYSTGHKRRSLVRTGRVLSAALGTVLLMATWNLAGSGSFSISSGSGLHLYNRVVTEEALLSGDGPATARLLSLVDERPLDGVPHWVIRPALEDRGLSNRDAVRLMGDVAMEGLLEHPVRFELYSLHLAWREYTAIPTLEPWPAGTEPVPTLLSMTPMGWRGSSLTWWMQSMDLFAALWPWLLWTPLLGLLLSPLIRPRLWFLVLFSVPVVYLFVTAHIEYFLDRYVVCVLPFALVLAPTPLAALRRAWLQARSMEAAWRNGEADVDRKGQDTTLREAGRMKAFLMSARGAAVGLAAALVVAAVWINVRSGASTAGTPEAQNWSLETHEGSRAVLEQLAPANSPDSMRVTISSLPEGAATWYVKLFQRSYAIDAGTRYRASFRARAEAARPVACAVGNNHEPWEGLGDYHEYTVTTEWSTYECPFTASADDSNARLFFDLGQSEGWVELTGVVLQDETNDRALQPN